MNEKDIVFVENSRKKIGTYVAGKFDKMNWFVGEWKNVKKKDGSKEKTIDIIGYYATAAQMLERLLELTHDKEIEAALRSISKYGTESNRIIKLIDEGEIV